MRNKIILLLGILLSASCLPGCNAFMHGYTWDKSVNSYLLVNGDKDNLGNRRIKYLRGFHKNSALENFLDCNCNNRGLPDLIYEYRSATKCRGVQLFYVGRDSVFVFEEPKKGNLRAILKEARQMDESERLAYQKLKQNN
jgi:hypothetical protein